VLPAGGPRRPPFWHAGDDPPAERGRRAAACHLDSLVRLLALAGWGTAAAGAGRLRDRLLDGEPQGRVGADFGRWRRRVQRSRMLRWATDGLGVLGPADAERLGVSGPALRAQPPHDATARWLRWLVEAEELLAGGPVPDGGPRGRADPGGAPPSRGLLDAAVELMPGLELSAARLLMASLDPDPDELAGSAPEEGRGHKPHHGHHENGHGHGGGGGSR
jgi:hypothetical protein